MYPETGAGVPPRDPLDDELAVLHDRRRNFATDTSSGWKYFLLVTFIPDEEMIHGSPLDGWSGSFFHSANMTFARWRIDEGAHDLHEHQHEQEEVWNVVRGSIVLVVDGIARRVDAGGAAVVPPHTPHGVRVTGAAEALVTDFPVRHQLPGIEGPR